MPSFCLVENCKRVKQIGDYVSFHKFPFHNQAVFKQWVEFIEKNSKIPGSKSKKVTKYSSICSQHFLQSDFSQSISRKFLKKTAVPTISMKSKSFQRQNSSCEYETTEVVTDDLLSNIIFCHLCKGASNQSFCTIADEHYFGLIRKCFPYLSVNFSFLKVLCNDCANNLNNFSMFIDRIITSQSFSLDNGRNNIVETIKVEPIVEPNAQFESELKFHNKTPSVHVANLGQPDFNERIEMNHLTPQKKCEILEIVDIKPFNFNMTINHEPYDEEDDIQILSPKQLKVELTDPDDVGGNELEQIRNYIFVSTVFLQDHNYSCNSVPLRSIDNNVKMEHEDCGEERFNADHESSHNLSIDAPIVKHCDLCKKSFKTPKEYIVHKIISHQRRNATKTLYCPNCRKKYCNNIVKLNIHKKICVKNVGRRNKKLFVRKEVTKKSFTKMIRKPQSRKKDSYVCPTCSKVFSGPKNLYQHKVSHTNIHYSCNLCNKKFKRPHGLRQHVKSIHEKNKKHICPICNYRYLLKADMIKCKHSKLKQIYIE